ncbi:MAG: DUF1836 domain-containing protein [Clostridiales Family XIII bacterium]|nr:DUF1836 domain-containing protein [Clostridiales Family XIII bacterium]
MIRYEEYIRKFAEEFSEKSFIEPSDFPNMDLYADQVAEFISEKLSIYEKEHLLTKSMISGFVKKDLIASTDKHRFNREHMILIESFLCLRMAYNKDDLKMLMKPFVENLESQYDDKIDFYDIYQKILPVLKEQRKDAATRTVGRIAEMKDAIWKNDIEDDDLLETFLILLSIAIEVDTFMYLGKRLLRAYFEQPTKEEKKETKKKVSRPKLKKTPAVLAEKEEKKVEKKERKSEAKKSV